jgi:hypothetical protein
MDKRHVVPRGPARQLSRRLGVDAEGKFWLVFRTIDGLPWRSTGCCAHPPPTELSAPASNRAATSTHDPRKVGTGSFLATRVKRTGTADDLIKEEEQGSDSGHIDE